MGITGVTADWTETEQWVWERIAAGEPADLNGRESNKIDLDPCNQEGWTQKRHLSVKFLQTILTQKTFVDGTSYGGVRILGALVDDAPLIFEYARLQHLFWLEKSRILVDVKCRNLRVEGEFSLKKSFVAGAVDLYESDIRESISFLGATFKGAVDLRWAKIGSNLNMKGATCWENVNLTSATVGGGAFLSEGATFKGEVNLLGAKIDTIFVMNRATCEQRVILNNAIVEGSVFLGEGATFKGEVNLVSAKIGGLDMN